MKRLRCVSCKKKIQNDLHPCKSCGFDNKFWKDARKTLRDVIDDTLKDYSHEKLVDRVMQLPVEYLKILGLYDEDTEHMRLVIDFCLDEEFGL